MVMTDAVGGARQSFGQLLLDPTMAMPTVPLLHWKRHQRHFPLIMWIFVALFAYLISLASVKLTMFFSHDKSANNTFQPDFSAKRSA
jgi:hypothetical protein